MVCRERYLPYDRVKVSKAMDFEIEKAQLRDDKFYKEYNIDVLKVREEIYIHIFQFGN